MMFDDELTLIKITHTTNDMGDSLEVEDRTNILCSLQSVTMSEHYQAAKHDVKPEIVFVINKYDYDNQQQVEYDSNKYRVVRSYMPKSGQSSRNQSIDYLDKLELVCEGGD